MNFIRKYLFSALIELIRFLKLLRCVFLYVFMRKKVIFVKAAVKTKLGGIKHFNWGDDINYYLLGLISKKKVIFLPHGRIAEYIAIPSFLGIGSIISFYNLKNTTIIGSGVINNQSIYDLKGKPSKVYFVRGPLTRSVLSKYGIPCPSIYGDLALTLPLYYKPVFKKIYRLGLVLHILDENLNSVHELQQNYPELKIIYMSKYKKWTDIIDEINSCEVIFSSALHGLIVSEAYRVCCQWISFNDRTVKHWDKGYEFKYIDFFESIEKKNVSPIEIGGNTNIYELANKVEKYWYPCDFDAKKLINLLSDKF